MGFHVRIYTDQGLYGDGEGVDAVSGGPSILPGFRNALVGQSPLNIEGIWERIFGGAHIHGEWTKKKFDEGKYVSSDIYGSPREPALIKEYQHDLKAKLGPCGMRNIGSAVPPSPTRRPCRRSWRPRRRPAEYSG